MGTKPRTPGVWRSALVATLLGTATTVGVAWGLAVGVDTIVYPELQTYRRSPGVQWSVQEFARWGIRSEVWVPIDWAGRNGESNAEFDARIDATTNMLGVPVSGDSARVLSMGSLSMSQTESVELVEHFRGWPLLALGCATLLRFSDGDDDRLTLYGFAYRPGRPASWDVDLVHLPLKPLFPGFYFNTALFASLWWALLFWRPLRRRRRIARGLCPMCGYSLAGLPPATDKCPECGTAMVRRAMALAEA
ncbi:MAG: hypothetical protein KF699_02185 [Phycisphaeraceae bacterium]|nr:hypothetical protein [Phycisphaeraceae bacterium]